MAVLFNAAGFSRVKMRETARIARMGLCSRWEPTALGESLLSSVERLAEPYVAGFPTATMPRSLRPAA